MPAVWVLLDDDDRVQGVYSSEALARRELATERYIVEFELDEPVAKRVTRVTAEALERARAERDAAERARAERDAADVRAAKDWIAHRSLALAGECERAGLPEPVFRRAEPQSPDECRDSLRDLDLATSLVLDLASLCGNDAVHAAVERRIRYGLKTLAGKLDNIDAYRALAGPFGEYLHETGYETSDES